VIFDDNVFPFTDSATATTTNSNLLENQILLPAITLQPSSSPTIEPDLMINQQRYIEPIAINTSTSEDLVAGNRE
jgi:hypothetical protein